MIHAALAAVAIGTGPQVREYRLTLRAPAGSRMSVRSAGPHGWLETFCTSRICAPGHVVVEIPSSGFAIVKYGVYRVEEDSARQGSVMIAGDSVLLKLNVTFR